MQNKIFIELHPVYNVEKNAYVHSTIYMMEKQGEEWKRAEENKQELEWGL